MPILFFVAAHRCCSAAMPLGAGRSPHVSYRPEQIDVRLDDVVGIDAVKDDVVRSLNLFLAHKHVRRRDGRHAAARPAVRGRARHRQDAPGQGDGAPRPACRSCSSRRPRSSRCIYGATARKIRSYFKALRKAARQEGGAIGFIEEIDAIAMARGGLSRHADAGRCVRARSPAAAARRGCRRPTPASARRAATQPPVGDRQRGRRRRRQRAARADAVVRRADRAGRSSVGKVIDGINLLLPPHRQLQEAAPASRPTSCSSPRPTAPTPSTRRCCAPAGSTAGSPSSRPTKAGRRELIDHFLATQGARAGARRRRAARRARRGHPGLHARR